MTRYLLLVNFDGGVVDTPMEEWKPEEVAAHLDYYRALNKELARERRAGRGRSPGRARPGEDRDRSTGATAPVVTDGPFQEIKEWLAGYMIVDVESEERAIEIAGEVLGRARAGRRPAQQPIQVRQMM